MNFDNFNLNSIIAGNVSALGYETPTPIQAETIPIALTGRDVVGLAQTGTGKTAAFALPILQRLTASTAGGGRHPRALIVAPTRELSEQILDSFKKLARGTGLRGTTIYGGVALKPQLKALQTGVDIVVACPGRLLDHVKERSIDLSHVEVLVLDEADHMFDMGFLPAIRKILTAVPARRQTLLFSATMPADILALAGEALTDPVTVRVDQARPTETVSHVIYPVEPHLKVDLLMEVLKHTDTESVLVFVAAKHRATRVAEKLAQAGYRATSLQGNLSQGRRQEALNGFRDRTYQIMVATDVAARGIDIASVSHVINFDMPNTLDSYTHRIGRTGRAARTGDAMTFVTAEDYGLVQSIERALGSKLERCYVAGFDYKAPAPKKDAHFSRPPMRPRAAAPKAAKAKAPAAKLSAVAPPRAARPRRLQFRGFAQR